MRVFKLVKFYILISIIASISSTQAMEAEDEKFQDKYSKLCFKEKLEEMKTVSGFRLFNCLWYNGDHIKVYAYFTAPGPLPDMKALDKKVITNQKLIIPELKEKLNKSNFGLKPTKNNPKPFVVKTDGHNNFMQEFNERLAKTRKEIEAAEEKEKAELVRKKKEAAEIERVVSKNSRKLRSEDNHCTLF